MLFYILVSVIGAGLIIGLNIAFNPQFDKFYCYIIVELIYVAFVFLMDALVAIIIRKLPAKHFDYHKKRYNPTNKEMEFFKKIKVNQWKDKIPELGGFTNFHKDKLSNPFDNTYIKRFLLEACYGYDIHVWSVPFSFVVIFLDYKLFIGQSNLWLTMALPTALINAFLIVLPAFILKYNMPRLISLYEFNLQREIARENMEN